MAELDFKACAAAAATALQKWYNTSTGLWNSTGWWNAANALTAVIGYTKLTGDTSHQSIIATTYTAAQQQHASCCNNFYDDNGWWGLAWVAAYDLTHDPRYLQLAQNIFTYNSNGWDDTCGGGVWWNEAKTYKNAIPNELFLTLAAQLHQRTPGDQTYLTWAQRASDWLSRCGVINSSHLINDGLTSGCANNGQTTWTYNQGVILGGLAALYQISGDGAYLVEGQAIADATLATLVSPSSAAHPGILVEPCELTSAGCSGDAVQFKGIFMRYLTDFWRATSQSSYQDFIISNATSIWENNRNASNQFGSHWTGPFDQADAGRQSSALDGLNAAIAVSASAG